MPNGPLAILSLESGKEFAQRIVKSVNDILLSENIHHTLQQTQSQEITFINGEIKYIIDESIRGRDVYITQLADDPHSPKSINDNLMALATAINAAFYADAHRITAVIPQFPYSRQDKKRGREGINAKVVGSLLESAGCNRVITLDIHSEAVEGFFTSLKIENLHCGRMLIEWMEKNVDLKNLMVVSPDVGSAKRGLFFSRKLNADLAIIEKVRNYSMASTIDSMKLVGSVQGKDVFINDDLLATGGTLIHACELLKNEGARDIFISVALPFFNDHAYKKFDAAFAKGYFKKVIGTDAVMWGDQFAKEHPWYEEISMAPLFAQVIYSLNQRKSVSKLLL